MLTAAARRIATLARQHPNISILLALALGWWILSKAIAEQETYHYEQDWLLIEPPPKGLSDLGPNMAAPATEWTIEAVCPSWIACQRFLKGSQACAAQSGDAAFHEWKLTEKCVARADPEGPFERFEPQPAFEGCDPSFTFSAKNCTPPKNRPAPSSQ
jgi:hypothetical protein